MKTRNSVLLTYVFYLVGTISAQQEGDIRLVGTGSNATQGRVEIYHNSLWGTVCDDQFEIYEAIVVCRQRGYSTSGAEALVGNTFGPGTGVIWMDGLGCRGTEAQLADCTFNNWNITDCSHSEDVGVRCPAGTPVLTTSSPSTPVNVGPNPGVCTTNDSNVRLIGPTNLRGVGVVQLKRNGIWGGVCDNDWDTNDAKVVCRMLCFSTEQALAGSIYFDTSNITESLTVSNVLCYGNETNITACAQSAWTPNICGRNETAKVTCVPLDNSAPTRPEPILECSNGSLTASFSKLRDPDLETKHLTLANTSYTGPCNVQVWGDTNYVSISIPFAECGTQRSSNATHIIYKNTILYLPTRSVGGVSSTNTYFVYVLCALPRDLVADKPLLPQPENVTVAAPGEFIVNLYFFRNNSFVTAVTKFPLEIPVGEYLYAAISLQNVDSNLRLVVPNCFATPSANRSDLNRYALFTNKCLNVETVILFPINDTWFGFRFQTFKFVQYSEVHIHCDAFVCEKQDPSPACDRSCFSNTAAVAFGRRKRSFRMSVIQISSDAIVLFDPNHSGITVQSQASISAIASSTSAMLQSSSTTSYNKSSNWQFVYGASTQQKGGSTLVLADTTKSSERKTTSPSHSYINAPLHSNDNYDSKNDPKSQYLTSDAISHVLISGSYISFVCFTCLNLLLGNAYKFMMYFKFESQRNAYV